jgi:hypothetical protein
VELSFTGHSETTRTINFDEADLETLSDAVRTAFLTHIEFACFRDPYAEYNRQLVKLCEKYGVDPLYTPDRLAFFKAVIEGK